MRKIFWAIRYCIYSLFASFKFPGYLGQPCFISNLSRIYLGKRVRIYSGLRAEISGKNGKIIIGNNVSIGQNFHVVANENPLTIGDNVVISGNVMISNCDHQYKDVNTFLYDQPLKNATTQIGNYCFIGYGAVLLAGTILGENCVIGANSVVRGVFPENSVIVGNPAKIVKKYNVKTSKWERC